MHTTILTLIDCILRSTSTHDVRKIAGITAEMLAKLAEPSLFPTSTSSQPANDELSKLRDLAERASCKTDSASDWDDTLRGLSTIAGQIEELGCVRQAAHTALRLRQLQSRFVETVEAEKREAIYHLAYGLSHELNNPLANIATRAGMLLRSTSNSDHTQLLNAICDNAMRGCEMLGDLMLTSRPPKLQIASVDLSHLKQVFLERGTRWAAVREVQFRLHWNVQGNCHLDQAMLCEIVWSVLRNAIEVSSKNDVVHVIVERTDSELHVQVEDDGPGLSLQALSHCFDPYFCGREAGRGLGLGLTKAKRLALLHGGDVSLANRAGRGCRAKLWIAIGEEIHTGPKVLTTSAKGHSEKIP